MRKLFGTDGIRGIAGEFPLDLATVTSIGAALAHTLAKNFATVRVLLGMDTRESGPELAAALAAGLKSSDPKLEVVFAGVLPTPAVAYLTRTGGFSAGVVISASHNPWQDNGIKIFGSDGYKLADAAELAIEKEILSRAGTPLTAPAPPLTSDPGLIHEYAHWLRTQVPGLSLTGRRILVDCANGAASSVAPHILGAMGADVYATHATPDGRNINDNCGALHPEVAAAEVVTRNADLGITFDGDADRVLFATSEGRVVNGDGILLLAALALQQEGRLTHNTVVATTMSNMGLENLFASHGIRMLRAPVGDKYVLEEMQKSGAVLGGEQSGHIIFTDRATTGDGLLTALVVLDMVDHAGRSLGALIEDLKTYPQSIVNVRVKDKPPLDSIPGFSKALKAAEAELGDRGRIVVRYSGTEKLARVMVEAEDEAAMSRIASHLAEIIRNHIGIE
jgi:phosphoglucosamine mutase